MDVIELVLEELAKAEEKHPGWPEDPFHALAILSEEVGELNQAVLQYTYEEGTSAAVKKEALQTAAMALRFLMGLSDYTYKQSEGA